VVARVAWRADVVYLGLVSQGWRWLWAELVQGSRSQGRDDEGGRDTWARVVSLPLQSTSVLPGTDLGDTRDGSEKRL
jgi:hypothetical protein